MRNYSCHGEWLRFKNQNDMSARNTIIGVYVYLIKKIISPMTTNQWRNYAPDDLFTVGAIGLINAVDNFDISCDIKFETYATAMIRGAILELFRSDDWIPRSIRADYLGVTVTELNSVRDGIRRSNILSLDQPLNYSDDAMPLSLADTICDDCWAPVSHLEHRDQVRWLARAIDSLPERERIVVTLYYSEQLTFKEIGQVLGVSETRAYQIYQHALSQMRAVLKTDSELFN